MTRTLLIAGLYENHIIDASGQMKEKYREEGFPLARSKWCLTKSLTGISHIKMFHGGISCNINMLNYNVFLFLLYLF